MDNVLTEIHNKILRMSYLLSLIRGRLDVIVQLSPTQMVINIDPQERLNVPAELGL
ncbi:MAG TPA: hypothetical protein G4O11_04350 [Anaerolineae bacterium]|nr:hypothetical protein [Anaerolineae bacterium]